MFPRHVLKFLLLSAIVFLALSWVAAANDGARPLSTKLTGAAEVPGPGDPDGHGVAALQLRPSRGEVCYTLNVKRISPATAAHVHLGSASVAGPVVIGLSVPTDGSTRACTSASPDLLTAIAEDPENYYVNVHNAQFPAGAVRGQLG